MKIKLALGAAVIAMGLSTPAQADILNYDVTNATGGDCAHGLWTNTLNSGCSRYYSFQDGSLFSVDTDTGTGTFTGTAINRAGTVATLDLSLSGLIDTMDGTGFDYKSGGGPYDPANQDYFSSASGTINVGGITYTLNPVDPFAGNTSFQFGDGANDKTGDFGGSAWLNVLNPLGALLPHFDINFDLKPSPTQVPAPAGALLLGFGLVGVWGARRRKAKVAAA